LPPMLSVLVVCLLGIDHASDVARVCYIDLDPELSSMMDNAATRFLFLS